MLAQKQSIHLKSQISKTPSRAFDSAWLAFMLNSLDSNVDCVILMDMIDSRFWLCFEASLSPLAFSQRCLEGQSMITLECFQPAADLDGYKMIYGSSR